MLDFSTVQEIIGTYSGSEKKKAFLYQGERYMVKFPDPIREVRNSLSYINNQFSEDISCKIMKSLDIPVQDTFLAKYTEPETGEEKVVVACKDFCKDGSRLAEFSRLLLARTTESARRRPCELSYIMNVIDAMTLVDREHKEDFKAAFWNMFVADALIGNPDRHNDNWGFLVKDDDISFAPVYDCGSALVATLPESAMKQNLANAGKLSVKEFNVKTAFTHNGKRCYYHEIFKDPPKNLVKAICRIVPRINMDTIYRIVDDTEALPELNKHYLKVALQLRYKRILAPGYKRSRTFAQ